MEDSIKDILEGMLKDIVSKRPNDYKTAFGILTKLLNNILENPNEPKFRVVKKSNLAISTKLLNIPEMIEVLEILGYELGTGEKENCYVYEGIASSH